MHANSLSATAVENLKRLAKKHRDATGQPLSESLEAVARDAGFLNWKQVAVLAKAHRAELMPASCHWRSHWVVDGSPRQRKCETVEELCEVLGGAEPVLLRSHCHKSLHGARCLCELDPFVTAKRANVAIDIGDKHDFWSYLYMPAKPFSGLNIVDVRVHLGLGSHGHSVNEHLLDNGNEDRSNSLNPNNRAHGLGMNNHSNQLNPNNERFRL